MKKLIIAGLSITIITISCQAPSSNTKTAKPYQFPKPGATVASAEEPIKDDPLNHFTFSVKVIADSNITQGVYDVDVDFGPNFAEGQFTMPKGGETYKPAIRKGPAPYTFIIGFKIPGDNTFYDYFEVSSSKVATKMQYIKAYTF